MTPVSLSQLASAVDGKLTGDDCQISGFSTDTRTVNGGDVYFCLRGDKFDGHDFVQDAIAKGAQAIVCEKDLGSGVPQLLVNDTRRAFGRFAMLWRQQFKKPVIGVTGSNGKTTVKQLLASIFTEKGELHCTRANDNNDIGVPQTLLGLREEHEFAVVEMGASAKGEIKWLGELVQPTVSVITNAGAAHLEGFGDAQSVAEEKAWIYRSLPVNGTAVVNADDRFVDYWKGICEGKKIITFGESGEVVAMRNSDGSISVTYAGETVHCSYQLPGQHNVHNAAAASACAIAAGVSLEVIGKGLAASEPVAGRLNFLDLANDITVVDDTYNANPASTRAAIDVLGELSGSRFVALGDLLELGANEINEHRLIGEYAQSNKVDRLYAYGELSKHAVQEFGAGGYWYQNQEDLIEDLIEALSEEVSGSCAVLVKGSRSMTMERVTAAVSERFSGLESGVCCQ